MQNPSGALIYITCILSWITLSTALKCYQCNSTTNSNCLEQFNYAADTQPQDCIVAQAGYCVKATGVWGATAGTFRFCSSYDLGNQCQYVNFLDFDRPYRACVLTCTGDGCNGASSMRRDFALLVSALAFALCLFRINH